MSIFNTLKQLANKSVEICLHDGKLKVVAAKGALNADDMAFLKANKAEIQARYEQLGIESNKQFEYLTSAQKRLWLVDTIEGQSRHYNMPMALAIHGSLNIPALKQSLQRVIERHATLRTVYVKDDRDEPIQITYPLGEFSLPEVDLRQATHPEQALQQLMAEHASQDFILDNDLMISACVAIMSESKTVLLVNIHHIAADGWSLGILTQELGHFYQMYSTGAPLAELPPLNISYLDYAAWQQAQVVGDKLRTLEHYWLTHLQGMPEVHSVPLDYPRPDSSNYVGDNFTLMTSPQLLQQLQQLANQQQVTLFMLLETAFCLLMAKYAGNDDVVIGTTAANRENADVNQLIGYFVNTLVLRHHVDTQQTLAQALQAHRSVILDAFEHQHMPFEQLVEKLQHKRATYNPLFQIMFTLENVPLGSLALDGGQMELLPQPQADAKFDLSLSTFETDDGLQMLWDFATDLFEETTVRAMADHFHTLLEAIVAQGADVPLRDLHCVSAAHIEQQLTTLNPLWNTDPAKHGTTTLLQCMQEAAALLPTRCAITSENQSLSYAEFNHQANQLARYLQQHGVKSGDVVGIMHDRSERTVVSVFAIWKLGAGYLPLDVSYPDDRLQYMAQDSQMALLITQMQHKDRLALTAQTPVVCLDEASVTDALATLNTDNLDIVVGLTQLAYLMYTSGSTGKPKGVLISQGAVAAYRQAVMDSTGVNTDVTSEQITIYACSSFSFDVFVEEMMFTFGAGNRMVMSAIGLQQSAQDFLAAIAAENVSLLTLPTSYWHYLAEELDASNAALLQTHLRYVLFGGEAMTRQHLERWQRFMGDSVGLWNVYGPTEGTVITTRCDVTTWTDKPGQQPPIGQGFANSLMLVLSEQGEFLPRGAAGELCFIGPSLADGYLHREDETAKRFPTLNANCRYQGQRMYRSGDKVRWGADGNLYFLGRLDNQVKVRGFRVEMSEVEQHIVRLAGIQNVIVDARPDSQGLQQLLAWVTLTDDAKTNGQTHEAWIQQWLAELTAQVPEYLVPQAIAILEQLPVSSHGKIDKKALQTPDFDAVSQQYVPPATDTEQQLVTIWSDLLQRDASKIGILDDFFQLGGHSLLATRLASAIQKHWQQDIPLRELFALSKIQPLAARIEAHKGEESPWLAPIASVDLSALQPLSFAQQTVWFVDQLNNGSPHYNMPVAIRLVGDLDVNALQAALNMLVSRHAILRTTYENNADGVGVQRIHQRAEVTITQHAIANDSDALLAQHIDQLAAETFDLSTQYPIKLHVLNLPTNAEGQACRVMLLVIHHIASDGWSMGVMTQELMTVYRAIRSGRTPTLPALPVQYADFAAWQQQQLGQLDKQLSYWQHQMADCPELHQFPLDFPRPSQPDNRGQIVTQQLSTELSLALRQLAKQHNVTYYMLFEAMFSLLIARWSFQDDIVVGCPIAGRRRAELEPLIGYFINILPIRLRIDETLSIAEYLQQAHDTVMDAYAHQDVPFDRLIEYLQPERNLSHAPLVQLVFTGQNTQDVAFELPEVTATGVNNGYESIKYDMNVALVEDAQDFVLYWNTASALFRLDTIEALAQSFDTLLHSLVQTDATQPLHHLQLVDANAEHALLALHGEVRDVPRNTHVAAQIADVAQQQPEAIALVCGDESLTFAQLNQQSIQVANLLLAKGVKPQQRIGVCLPRSLFSAIGFLAIQQVGAVCVQMEATSPAQRLAYVLQDSQCALLLTTSDIGAGLASVSDCAQLHVDSAAFAEELATYSVQALTQTIAIDVNDLSYLLYTSGTTGHPKGALVSHNNLNHFVVGFEAQWQALHQPASLLQTSSFAFDASMVGYAMLAKGNKVVLADDMQVRDPAALVQLGKTHQTPAVKATLSLALTLLAELERCPDHSMGLVLSGEMITPTTWCRLQAYGRAHSRAILNTYGPSETTVNITFAEVNSHPQQNIGRFMPNVRGYVLDKYRNVLPKGALGELYIGGESVTQGYWNKPEQTAQMYVRDNLPRLATTAGDTLLYRSGDLVRLNECDQWVFATRIGQQIKIRGYRIELHEISAKVAEVSHVENTLADVFYDGDMPHVVAYVKTQQAASDLEPIIMAHLQQHLPDYMIPSAIICLTDFPLTISGKIDKRALPEPSFEDKDFVALEGEIEQKLAAIWGELLSNAGDIGRKANFFRMGGHSLLATRMLNAIAEHFSVTLPLRVIFEAPVLQDLANVIDAELVVAQNQAQLAEELADDEDDMMDMEW